MEQRRFSGKGHWYHETQSNRAQSDVLPLVPEAANVDDRFLLDLALPDEIVAACSGWLTLPEPYATSCFRDSREPSAYVQRLRQAEHRADGRPGLRRSAAL
jgi:uncharacterized protein YciW